MMPPSVALHVRRVGADLRRQGLPVRDMSAGGALELAFANGASDAESPRGDDGAALEWIEDDPLRPRDVTRRAAASPFRYFLDATQRSLPCFHVGAIPVVCGFVAAGILERDALGSARLAPGAHVFDQFFVAPARSGLAAMDETLFALTARGDRVVDPLANVEDDHLYQASLHDFGALLTASLHAVSIQRQRIEVALLEKWVSLPRDGVLIVDGPIRSHAPGAIGVVKSFATPNLGREAAATLFDLKMNQRTALFRIGDAMGRRAPVRAWHQRFWEPAGLDPRHALVRIETSDDSPAGTVEDLAGWLMDERVPRATNDQRWPTLLYPIHYLEQILKKQLDAATRGWPGQ